MSFVPAERRGTRDIQVNDLPAQVATPRLLDLRDDPFGRFAQDATAQSLSQITLSEVGLSFEYVSLVRRSNMNGVGPAFVRREGNGD
jgi:hypothetical protein